MRPAAFWIVLVALTLGRTLGLFGSAGLAFDDQPLMNADYPLHAYHAELGERFRTTRGTRWGYDPGFMAGYLKSPHFDASVSVFEWARPWCSGLFQSQKAVVVATPLLVLAGMVVALWGFGLSPAAVRIGGVLTLLEFWLSLPIVFVLLGMTGSVVGIGLALGSLGLLHRGLVGAGEGAERGRADLVASLAFFPVAALALRIHPHAMLVTGLGVAMLCLAARGRLAYRAAAVGWVGAVTLTWLIPYLAFLSRVDTKLRGRWWALARPDEPLRYFFALDDGARQAGTFELALLAVAAWAILRAWRAGRRVAAGGIGATYAALFAITFYGSLTEIGASLQPLRFAATLAHLSVIPAAAALAQLADTQYERPAAAVGLILLALVALGQREFAGLLRVGLSADDRKLLALVSRLRPDARVLIEDSAVGGPLGGVEDSGGGLLPLVPLLTGHEVIGGPVTGVYLTTCRTNAADATLFGQPAETLDAAPLLARYNVGAAFVWSKAAHDAIARVPGFTQVGTVGRLVVLVRTPPGAVLEGSGRVRAEPDRIVVSDARAAGGRLVLAYHWDPVLAVEPPARLVPVTLGDDPVPFLGVESPPPAFTIAVPPGLTAWSAWRRERESTDSPR